jgi:hypothetical protein
VREGPTAGWHRGNWQTLASAHGVGLPATLTWRGTTLSTPANNGRRRASLIASPLAGHWGQICGPEQQEQRVPGGRRAGIHAGCFFLSTAINLATRHVVLGTKRVSRRMRPSEGRVLSVHEQRFPDNSANGWVNRDAFRHLTRLAPQGTGDRPNPPCPTPGGRLCIWILAAVAVATGRSSSSGAAVFTELGTTVGNSQPPGHRLHGGTR